MMNKLYTIGFTQKTAQTFFQLLKDNNIKYYYFTIRDELIINDFANKQDGLYYHRDDLAVVFSLTDKYAPTGKYYKIVAQMFY